MEDVQIVIGEERSVEAVELVQGDGVLKERGVVEGKAPLGKLVFGNDVAGEEKERREERREETLRLVEILRRCPDGHSERVTDERGEDCEGVSE